MFRRIVQIVFVVVIAAVAYLLLWPTDIDPVAWDAPEPPPLEGDYAVNDALAAVEVIGADAVSGPEDVAIGPDGRIYAAALDGRIVRMNADGSSPKTVTETGGRPLGLAWDPEGRLIVADADQGLLRIDVGTGSTEVLATEAGGVPFKFTDDVDIGSDGTIYFTDASSRWSYGDAVKDIFEHRENGRFLSYDPASGETRVLLDKLQFANGVAVDPETLLGEMDGLTARGVEMSGLIVSDRAHVVMPFHKLEDRLREEALAASVKGAERLMAGEIGTTRRGIGPCYAEKANRATAIRIGDLVRPDVLRERLRVACSFKEALLGGLARLAGAEVPVLDEGALFEQLRAWGERLAPVIGDTRVVMHDMMEAGERLLFEGANATLLDVDHGTYPYVTASNACAIGISAGTGVPSSRIGRVFGVLKAYSTRVGAGPMPTELLDETGDRIRERGREYGTTTGRPRRIGWLDLVAARYAGEVNGVDELAVTLLDVLSGFETLRGGVGGRIDGRTVDEFVPDGPMLDRCEPVYEEVGGFAPDIDAVRTWDGLPEAARAYLGRIESFVDRPIRWVGVGPARDQTIVRRSG